MTVRTESISLNTRGNADIQDITDQIAAPCHGERIQGWHCDCLLSLGDQRSDNHRI